MPKINKQQNLSSYVKDYRKSVKIKLSASRRHYSQAAYLAESGGLKTQNNRNMVYEEIEAAIYYASSAFDILCQEVNWSLALGIEEKKVSVRAVMTRLGKHAHERYGRMHTLLTSFVDSEIYNTMKEPRNQVTHRSVMDDLTIKVYPWLDAVPELGSRVFKKAVVIGNRVIRLDRSIAFPYKLEAAENEGEDLPSNAQGLAIIMWRNYPLFQIIEDFLEATSTIVSRVEKILDE